MMSDWVTDVPNMNGRSNSLQYRFLVAMQGALGIGANLNKWNDQDMQTAKKLIDFYKQIRPTVQNGDQYRLRSPRTEDVAATQYVAADGKQSVLFVYRHSQEYNTPAPPIYLRGLDPNARYRVTPLDGKQREQQQVLTGAFLMDSGLHFNLRNDYDATAVVLDRVQ
jgi:alpha-galactosidase